jgi:glucokinase
MHERATLTNIGWPITAAEIAAHFGNVPVRLMNDLEAMATSVEALEGDELAVLQEGTRDEKGNAVVIAAGTGLGEAFLHRVDGRFHPVPSEGGHADFAARTDREIDLLRMLREDLGRAEVEQVLSGPGLVNLYRLTHGRKQCPQVPDPESDDAPAQISTAGLDGSCARCVEALGMFVEAYGAEAGNLAVRGVATGGVYIGGGIAPKILPALRDGRFMGAFRAKEPMDALVARVPVSVILNEKAGLLGAAVAAARLIA